MQSNINLRAALAETWGILRANPGKFLLVLLLFELSHFPFNFFDNPDVNVWPLVLFIISSPLWIVLGLWLSAGLTLLTIRAAAGEAWRVGHLFGGGRWIMRFFGISLLMSIPMMACMLICVVGLFPLFMVNTPEDVLWPSNAVAAGEVVPDFEFTGRRIAMLTLLQLLTAWITAWFSFAWYLAIDKEMPWLNAVKHCYKMVRGMVIMLALLQFLFTLPTYVFALLPIPDFLATLIYPVSTVIMSLITAILYRERLREMEADGRHPLGRRSILSLPREDDPWVETGEAEVEN